MKQNTKRLLIKLGTDCNLGCPHCHQTQKAMKENPDLLDWIAKNGYNRITFSGGEPLMYFDTIKRYMEYLGKDNTYRMMSNGTLLTDEMVEFFNGYDMKYCISYDGVCGGRDLSIPIQWDTAKKLNTCGMCTVYSDPNTSYRDFLKDIDTIFKKHDISFGEPTDFLKLNWIHQTKHAPNPEFTQEIADKYIKETTEQLEKLFWCVSRGMIYKRNVVNLIGRWYSKKRISYGVACCNESLTSVNIDGTIMLCPYGTEKIGTIYDEISNETLDSFIPMKCKQCENWDICRCTCIENITELDCYVNKKMIKIVKELIEKFDIQDTIDDIFGKETI